MNTQMNIVRDPVDDLLKSDATAHRDDYIDDGGFTLSVMDALPARTKVSPVMRFAIPFGFTVIATVIVAMFTGSGNFLIDAAMDIATSSMTQSAIAFMVIVTVLLTVSMAAASDH